tara:strand:+ start:1437 stop:1838 length:402 start_codon:yes stop_codon:yes gene_type:complete
MNNTPELSPFVVTLNAEKSIEYFRDRPLSEKQQADLAATDKKLNLGFTIAGEFIKHPTDQDKAIFMANLLANALSNHDDTAIAVSCTYLATRYVHLKQLKITSYDDRISIELINDQLYADPIPIKFIPKKELL